MVHLDVNFDKVREKAEKKLESIVKQAVEDMRELAPVDTGELRNSIGYTNLSNGDKILFEIMADAPYAAYVEYGTSRRSAHPFMGPVIAKLK
jgi:HK97 gp10 family phage protein